jgi:hypothetical protein
MSLALAVTVPKAIIYISITITFLCGSDSNPRARPDHQIPEINHNYWAYMALEM